MAIEDCYFFLTTGCNKGEACKFRHSLPAKLSLESCPDYINNGTCTNQDCGKRHSTFHLHNPKEAKDVCYFERVKGACTKDSCPFKHFRKSGVEPAAVVASTVQAAPVEQQKEKEEIWGEAVQSCKNALLTIEESMVSKFSLIDAIFAELRMIEEGGDVYSLDIGNDDENK
jgi:hypothetical protein